jgi:hypothetical protein
VDADSVPLDDRTHRQDALFLNLARGMWPRIASALAGWQGNRLSQRAAAHRFNNAAFCR